MAKTKSYDVAQEALNQGAPNTINVTSYAEGLGESAKSITESYTIGDTSYVLQYELNPTGDGYLCTGRGGLEVSAIEIPHQYEGLPVIGIAASAFEDDTIIRSVVVSHRLEYIGENAFCGSGIRNITFPTASMLKEIADGAFQSSDLHSINIPISVTTIGESAFRSCKLLESVALDGDSDRLYFRNTLSLSNIKYTITLLNGKTISGVLNIHEKSETGDIYTVTFPMNAQSIAISGTQYNSNNIITLPALAISTSNFVFGTCYEILMDGVSLVWSKYDYSPSTDPDAGMDMTIKSYAFADCPALSTMNFTNRVVNIEANVMSNCVGLTTVNFGKRLTYVSEFACKGCTSLGYVTFGKQMKRIESSAFEGCSYLDTISFPAGLDWIGRYAFKDCPLNTAQFLCPVGWLYTPSDEAEHGTGIARSILADSRNGAYYLNGDIQAFNLIRITEMLPPQIQLTGSILSITDTTGLAEYFNLYINGTKRCTIYPE